MLQETEQNKRAESPKIKKIQQYIFCSTDKIGEGRFSQVYSGVDKNLDETVAVKVVQLSTLKSKTAHKLLENEIKILKDLDHSNVIKCRDVITSINNCYIVFQMCEGGDLETILHQKGKFHEGDIYKIVYDLYNGLLYLNDLSIIHRDLKIANIFIGKNGQTKIADFGFATKGKSYFKDINIGSPIYMSPEGLISNVYSPKTDVWSFGVILYELVHGQPPLAHCKTEQQLKEHSLLEPKIDHRLSQQLKEFIKICLIRNPQQRPDVKDLYATSFMKKVFEKMGDNQIPKALIQTVHTMDSTTVSKSTMTMEVESKKMDVQENREKVQSILFKEFMSYEQALALVHYCRLIYKTCKINESKVLIEWLLLISYSLSRARIDQKHPQSLKLNEVITEYNQKYSQQYQQIYNCKCFTVTIDEAIRQCKQMRKSASIFSLKPDTPKSQKSMNSERQFGLPTLNISPKSQSHLKVLLRETEELKVSLRQNRLDQFSKSSQIQSYLKKQL